MGRSASGVRGINLDGNVLVGMEIATTGVDVLVVTEKGYGKKTPIDEYRITSRGGKGVKTVNITEKNGSLVSLKTVDNDKDLMIITDTGMIIRLAVEKISTMSRVTQGVRLINLKDEQTVSTAAVIEKNEESEENSTNSDLIVDNSNIKIEIEEVIDDSDEVDDEYSSAFFYLNHRSFVRFWHSFVWQLIYMLV